MSRSALRGTWFMIAGIAPTAGHALVLDTNIVLDLLLFGDPSTLALSEALSCGALVWHATLAMRDELQRVLGYPAMHAWMRGSDSDPAQLLARFDRLSHVHPEVATGPPRCRDPDDQKFIDLALVLQAMLLSKDRAVLRLRRPLAERGVTVTSVFRPAA
ncbi:MAG: putative toxin-antitoxin system toxin component, PIN family [Betaproteobacteria bacterium]